MTSGPQASDLDRSKPGWYLALMAPRDKNKGDDFAWLDPSRIYLFPEALKECTDDLLRPFEGDKIDMVIGVDAMGFVLGTSMAIRLGVGFLTIRKVDKLCVEADKGYFSHYLSKADTKACMEMRTNPFPSGTRVLIVDQWIQTGGTMGCAANLVEQAQGVVAGMAVICREETENSKRLEAKYKVVHCTPPELQGQVNAQWLESFKLFPGYD